MTGFASPRRICDCAARARFGDAPVGRGGYPAGHARMFGACCRRARRRAAIHRPRRRACGQARRGRANLPVSVRTRRGSAAAQGWVGAHGSRGVQREGEQRVIRIVHSNWSRAAAIDQITRAATWPRIGHLENSGCRRCRTARGSRTWHRRRNVDDRYHFRRASGMVTDVRHRCRLRALLAFGPRMASFRLKIIFCTCLTPR